MDNIIQYIKNTCDGNIFDNSKFPCMIEPDYEIVYICCGSPYINEFEILTIYLCKTYYKVKFVCDYRLIKDAIFPRSGNMKNLKLYIASYLYPSQA